MRRYTQRMTLLANGATETRPWGSFERFTANETSTVKIISVNPIYANSGSTPNVVTLWFSPSQSLEKIQIKHGYRINLPNTPLKLDCSSRIEKNANWL